MLQIKVPSINMLHVAKQAPSPTNRSSKYHPIINSDFVYFFDKNVKTYPGKTSIKFNIIGAKG